MVTDAKRWGFPGFDRSKVIFNARSESVLEKKMFRESIMKRRLIVPATAFYEWNSRKEKVTFLPMEGRNSKHVLYMAGFYNHFADADRFVILTTAANASMIDVHDRMPLLLEDTELEDWLWEDWMLEKFLRKRPAELRKKGIIRAAGVAVLKLTFQDNLL